MDNEIRCCSNCRYRGDYDTLSLQTCGTCLNTQKPRLPYWEPAIHPEEEIQLRLGFDEDESTD